MRDNRRTYNELTPKQRKKANARAYANTYQTRGLLKKEPCQKCGSEKSQKHHPDYSKPLLVEWLCRPCHMAEHRGIRETNPVRSQK